MFSCLFISYYSAFCWKKERIKKRNRAKKKKKDKNQERQGLEAKKVDNDTQGIEGTGQRKQLISKDSGVNN